MSFLEKDNELQTVVLDALCQRQIINANKDIGTAYLYTELVDRLNPSVTITKEDIRRQTGRTKVRGVVMDLYAKALQRPNIVVERTNPDELKVTLVPTRIIENNFKSLKDLQIKNSDDIENNPEIGDIN